MSVKRFIAGAVCPRCGDMDRLRTYRDDQREYRECVSCGYEDAMRLDGEPEAQEVETRVTRPSTGLAADEQVLQFVANPKRKH
ncbi:YheV family putative zinc ribbon protein [Motiliproteus sediminis]|uniref:YheV family putative zinc ribbon protein n=1 Tax=Motiliproteus sediminis TaxID=1468178 RepID=UPI001AEF78D8|nr:YheV family putative zinc ribbon protein [Motiliproteus sediminis]